MSQTLLEPVRESADPSRRQRRWIVSSWMLSLIFHSLAFALLVSISRQISKGITAEEAPFEVGIALKDASPEATVFETESGPATARSAKKGLESAALEQLDQAVRAMPLVESMPKLDLNATGLSAAGETLRDLAEQLPSAGGQGGQGSARVSFLGAEAEADCFVWVIDRSASMSHNDAIDFAKNSALEGLQKLKPHHQFQMIFYDTQFQALPAEKGLLDGSRPQIDRARAFLQTIKANGGTEHNSALLAAIALKPEVIFFLTDADMMTDRDVRMLTETNRRAGYPAIIYTIEFGDGPAVAIEKPLQRLARENDGTYSYVDVRKLGSN